VSLAEGSKNLVETESQIEKRAAGATKITEADIKGKIVETAWRLKKEGYSPSTISTYPKFLRLLVRHGANLYDPESVKEVIAEREAWGTTSKIMAIAAYTFFASINEIRWQPPKYKQTRKLPFIPLESEIDALIARSGKKIAALLQLLKETGMRIGEAYKLNWIDIDLANNTVTVNEPEKNGNARMLKTSNKLSAMLNALPRKGQRVFEGTCYSSLESNFHNVRKRTAEVLKNPRLLSIHFHTLRHWKATMEYHKTKDILYVKRILGHERIENTLLYTQLVTFESDEYHSAIAETMDEAKKLVEAGFEYVCTHEGAMLFRKRK